MARAKDQAKVREAGNRLRQLRTAKQLTQLDIFIKTNGQLSTTFISRIESGAFNKPPAPDWILYGDILDVEPNELARMYGYWRGASSSTADEEPSVSRLRSVLNRLPPEQKAKLENWVEFSIARILADMAAGNITRDALREEA